MTQDIDPSRAPVSDVRTDETPVKRALRLKMARIEAREKPPRGGRFQREQAARVKSGAARPWSHK